MVRSKFMISAISIYLCLSMNAQSGKAMGGICRNALEWSIFSLGKVQAKRITVLQMLPSIQSLTHVVLCALVFKQSARTIRTWFWRFCLSFLLAVSAIEQAELSIQVMDIDVIWCEHSWCRDMSSLSASVHEAKWEELALRMTLVTKEAICTSLVPTTYCIFVVNAGF